MEGRERIDLADSTRAIMEIGFWFGEEGEVDDDGDEIGDEGGVSVVEGWRSGRMCRRTSVTKCRSEGAFTLGMTSVSRLGDLSCSK